MFYRLTYLDNEQLVPDMLEGQARALSTREIM